MGIAEENLQSCLNFRIITFLFKIKLFSLILFLLFALLLLCHIILTQDTEFAEACADNYWTW